MLPIADEEERRETRELPENGEEEEVVGEHHSEHRPHEEREARIELARRVGGTEVVARVQNHEQTDPKDQERKEQCEAVEA